RRCHAEKTHAGHPPDMPDQCEAHDHREERGYEAGRGVPRYFDWRVFVSLQGQLLLREHALFPRPESIDLFDARLDRKIPGRRWRCGRPFQGAAIPGVAGRVAELLTMTNGNDDLDNLTDNSGEHDDGTGLGDQ